MWLLLVLCFVSVVVYGSEASVQMPTSGSSDSKIQFLMDTHQQFKDKKISEVQYCQTIVSRLYRSDLDEMFVEAKRSGNQSCLVMLNQTRASIDGIGKPLFEAIERSYNSDRLKEKIINYYQDGVLPIMLNAKKGGNAALIQLCISCQDALRYLLQLKDVNARALIDVNIRGADDKTPLMWASFFGKQEIVQELVQSGLVDVNVANIHGRTALFWACERRCYDIALNLLRHGADITMCDNLGQSSLDIVKERYDQDHDAHGKIVLRVFDALKPDVATQKLGFLARLVKDAYEQFQRGNVAELYNVLFVMPLIFIRHAQQADYANRVAVDAVFRIFKKESIGPLITWLDPQTKAEKWVAAVYLCEGEQSVV